MVLMVFLSASTSPFASTVILRERSPLATAVVTSAMLRTCAVRLLASRFTLSVRSFQMPATAGTSAWPPSLPSVPPSFATRVASDAEELAVHRLALDGELHLLRQIAVGHRGEHSGDLGGGLHQIADQGVDGVEVCEPTAGSVGERFPLHHAALAAHDALDAHDLVGHRLAASDDVVEGPRNLGDDAGAARERQ